MWLFRVAKLVDFFVKKSLDNYVAFVDVLRCIFWYAMSVKTYRTESKRSNKATATPPYIQTMQQWIIFKKST